MVIAPAGDAAKCSAGPVVRACDADRTFSAVGASPHEKLAAAVTCYHSRGAAASLLPRLQVMQPNAAQLAAAVAALINALVASKFSTTGVMGMMNSVSYARWGLEGE
jgi:hypothetical protein